VTQISGVNSSTVLKGTALRLDAAIKGCLAAFPPGITTLPIRNGQLTQQDIQNKLAALNAPFVSIQATRLALHQFTQAKPQYSKDARQFLGDLHQALSGAVGGENQLLAQWGFKVKKPAKSLTSEQGVIRAAKAKLTRKKRGTLGSRQKAAIKTTGTPTIRIGADGTSEIISDGTTPASNGSVTPTNT